MIAVIEKSRAVGKIVAPPSKSMSHRALIAGGLAGGKSRIAGIIQSEDMLATLEAISALGSACRREDDVIYIEGSKEISPIVKEINCRESGSTLRFFVPIFLLSDKEVILKAHGRLPQRPMGIYEAICKEQGLTLEKLEDGIRLQGPLKAGEFSVEGNISSQFITGLLFALPLLEEDSVIHLIPPVESRPYIDMTLQVLEEFGIKIESKGNDLFVKGGQHYQARDYVVEGDYSNAAFLDAYTELGGDVEVEGLREDSLQGDKVYKQCYEMLKEENQIIDLTDCPDLGPVLMAVAAAKNGATFTGAERLKIKESDRGAAMISELGKFRIKAYYQDEDIVVEKGELQTPTEVLDGYNDHRIVMALSLLLSLTGGQIADAQAVKKSYPYYFSDIEKLGIKVTLNEDNKAY